MANDRIAERQRVFKQYKEDVRTRGKPFFPGAMLHDTIMSLVVVVVIITLAVIWKWSVPGDHASTASGWLGKLYDEPADPGTFSFVPRPDWYFYFLFYLLRIFKWPSTVILGTVGIPTILLLLLMAMPFIDVRPERNPAKRPVAMVAAVLTILTMGILTYRGATAKESLATELVKNVPTWAKQQGFQNNPTAVAGATLFASVGCMTCHTYLGAGSSNVGAPDLSKIGATNQGVEFFQQYVADPSKSGNNVMPKFGKQYGGALTDAQLHKIAVFLDASKGPK
ncbi:MAG TPA: c-type cytochrome [Gaiellaceae bacterium]|nr:c-type cytochrome [Gaiellaceae bacterium]